MDEGDAFRRDRDAVHRKAHEVTDSCAYAAVEHKDVFTHLQLGGHLSLQDMLELGLTKEEGFVVLHPHHDLEALVRNFAEGGLEDLVRVLQLIEEGAESLHLVDHGVVGDAVGREALASVLHIQLWILLNVQVFIGDECPVVHQHGHVKLLGHHVGVAFDVEEAFHSPTHGIVVHVPVFTNHPVAIGLLNIPLEPLDQVLFAGRVEDGLGRVGVQDFVHLNLQYLASHVHPCNLHVVVGCVDGREVLFNFVL